MVSRIKIFFLNTLGGIVFTLALGFVFFLCVLPSSQEYEHFKLEPQQAVVIFTGSSVRLTAAAELLPDTYNGQMMISGVNKNVTRHALLEAIGWPADKEQGLTLDYGALTTYQNVLSTRQWAQALGITKLSVVTSNYHIPRSRNWFRWLAPELEVNFIPVARQGEPISLLFGEYIKFLLSCFRL